MKKALYLLLVVFALQSNNLFAQNKKSKEKESKDFVFTKGNKIKERKLSIMSSVAGHDNNNLYLIGFRPSAALIFFVPVVNMRYIFQSYNMDDMSLDKANRTNAFTKQFKRNRFFASDMINEDPYMFTYENVKDGKKQSLAINYYSIDKGTMKPSTKSKLVTIPKTNVKGSSKFRYVLSLAKNNTSNNEEKVSTVNYLRSPDKKSFYIVLLTEDDKKASGGKKNKTRSFNIHVRAFDNNMEPQWEKDEKFKFDNAGTIFTGLDADNIGNVYFTVKDYKDKKKGEAKKGDRNYDYKLFYINKDKEELQMVKLDLGDKFVTEMNVKVFDDSVGAVCTGFYYDDNSKRKKDNVSGTFVGLVDKDNNEMLDENFYEFTDDLYSQDVKVKAFTFFGKQKGSKEENKGTEDVELRKVYVRPDGNIIVTGERYYWYVTYVTSGTGTSRTTRTVYHYIHNDILVNCISPAGKTEWSVRIPKFQHEINSWSLSSFIPLINGNDIYFVYNDHQDNVKLTTSGTFSHADLSGKNNALVAVKVNADGDVSKYKLSSKTELEGFAVIAAANNVDNKKIILPVMSKWGRLLKFGVVDFKAPKE